MKSPTFFDMSVNMFTYENPGCECKIATNYNDEGEPIYSFLIKRTEKTYKYAYASNKGLVMLSKNGAILEYNKIIEDFLCIKNDSPESIQSFVEKYGFFIPLSANDRYTSFIHFSLTKVIERFQNLVSLFDEINNNQSDYNRMFFLVKNLLENEATIISKDKGFYNTDIHKFCGLWKDAYELPNQTLVHLDDIDPLGELNKYYLVSDTFTNQHEKLYIKEYDEFVPDSYSPSGKKHYDLRSDFEISISKIYKLYRDYFAWTDTQPIIECIRYYIDLLFHMIKNNILQVDSASTNGLKEYDLNSDIQFNETYKKRLIDIGKMIIKKELDFQLKNIHPIYDIEAMSPNLEIPSFYSALYLSVFYTRPGYEIYRQCANPNCGCFFKVKSTNNRKRYHSSTCQNAAAQRRYQQKKKSNSSPV